MVNGYVFFEDTELSIKAIISYRDKLFLYRVNYSRFQRNVRSRTFSIWKEMHQVTLCSLVEEIVFYVKSDVRCLI